MSTEGKTDAAKTATPASVVPVPTPAGTSPVDAKAPAPATTVPPTSGVDGDDDEPHGGHEKTSLRVLALGALGVVYGDIGTSPLYALRECFRIRMEKDAAGLEVPHGLAATHDNVLGVLSLVFWSLLFIITVKYIANIMRADNRGEGGILSLMALAGTRRDSENSRASYVLLLLGLFGSALLYGDGIITPAISVLSAVEGLEVATVAFKPFVIPITLAILVGLFAVQSQGTGRVGAFFGPVMAIWFLVLAALGVSWIMKNPAVVSAVNPMYAVRYFSQGGMHSIVVLGSVFLVVTGGEALYADMGHFGRRPIRIMWFAVVLPALVLNYFGQGALLLADPSAAADLFFRMVPGWALYPVVFLATLATVIASQALISASFSLTRQAVQLGYCPRVQIIHTSSKEIGQIYVPGVNYALMLACLGLVLGFKNSEALAAAYGIAVTMTMAITTVLFFAVARSIWGWGLGKAILLCGSFMIVDLAFFGANALKVADGGWFPLTVGAGVFVLMTSWKRGREILGARLRSSTFPIDTFLDGLKEKEPHRVVGTAVFMSGAQGVPHALLHNLKHNKILHERNLLLTIVTEEYPKVSDEERFTFEDIGYGFYRLVAHFGFMETPDVPKLLATLKKQKKFDFKMSQTTFFLGRETLIASARRKGMAVWREHLFAWMSRNARSATSFFGLPPNRVVELGAQIEI